MKFRIKEYTNDYTGKKFFIIQKKSWMGFWYNSLSGNALYDKHSSLDNAKRVLGKHTSKFESKVVYEAER